MNQFASRQQASYRGALVYRPEDDGYTMTITITVSIAPDEHSSVISHVYNLPVAEEAEHLEGVDLYHFPVTDGTRIQLTITSPIGAAEVWYTVSRNTVLAIASSLHLSIIRASETITPARETRS